MGDIITLVTAIVGCMLGVYNFVENIFEKIRKRRTNIEFYSHHTIVNYKIINPMEYFINDNYDAAEEDDAVICFSIKNNSSHTVFFHECSFINFKRNSLFYGMEKTEVGTVSSHMIRQSYYKYEDGNEIPIMCPLKIESYDICTIIYKVNEKRGYFKSKDYDQILLLNAKERKTCYDKIKFSYKIDNKYFEENIYANVSYYKEDEI